MGVERSREAAELIDALDGVADESLFRAHFENLPGPAYIWRRSGDDFRLIAHNKAAARLAESPAAKFLGASAIALQREHTTFVPRLHECVRTGEVFRDEIDYRYAGGATRRLIMTLIPLSEDIVVHHTEDITDRYLAERALRASEARSRALMEANPDMLVRVSREGEYLDVHIPDKISANIPMRAEHFLGHNVAELFEPEFARAHERYRLKALETGEVQSWQYARMAGGKMRHIDSRFLRSGDNEVVIAVTDVTDRVDLEREIVRIVDKDRSRIGHDLHDGLGQLLTGVKLMLEPLKKSMSAGGQAQNDMQQAIDLLNQAIGQTSELARGLSPVPRNGGVTLANALEQLVRKTADLFGISCFIAESRVAPRLTEECSNNLYRIAQEAITNAVKHGKANNVELRCRVENGRQMLTILDDGIGFGGAKMNERGMGMHIMRYRARAIGGDVVVTCAPNGGVLVSCRCPVPLPPYDGLGDPTG